jgi:hypothetical protein
MKTLLPEQSTQNGSSASPLPRHRWRKLFLKRISQKNPKPLTPIEPKAQNWDDFTVFNKSEE